MLITWPLCLCTGILAYLGFGPYQEQGRVLWNEPLNYYLLPVIVRVPVYSVPVQIGTCMIIHVLLSCVCPTDSDIGGVFHCLWVPERVPHGSRHHLHLCL